MIQLCTACANEFKGVGERENPHEIKMCTQNAKVLDLMLAVT